MLLTAALFLAACQPVIESRKTAVTSQLVSALRATSPPPTANDDKTTFLPLLITPNSPPPVPLESLYRTASDPKNSQANTYPKSPNELPELPEEADQGPRIMLLPDSEIVYSPTALDFDTAQYLTQANGFLSKHREYLRSTGWTSAAEIVQRVALENSINPRLLLALVEYQTHCVRGQPDADLDVDYLIGSFDYHHRGFYRQLSWMANQISAGYYAWRAGTLTEILLSDGTIISPAPEMNAGSVALQYYFAQVLDPVDWQVAISLQQGLVAVYTQMFPQTLSPSRVIEPLLPDGLSQPDLILPFEIDSLWSFTRGPHSVWDTDSALAALDFAPATMISGCVDSNAWVVAVADGLVVRSEFGAVTQDLSGDGLEQTGWAIFYLHIRSDSRVAAGTYLRAGEPIGHPSCEGGRANGTHVHIARKYNGEWITATGTLPFVLSGWTAHAGSRPFEGSLTRGKRTVIASPYGISASYIMRTTADS